MKKNIVYMKRKYRDVSLVSSNSITLSHDFLIVLDLLIVRRGLCGKIHVPSFYAD